jgi:hypothetical protein
VKFPTGQDAPDGVDYAFFIKHIPKLRITLPMTNRVSYAPQDFCKMCEQAERDHESKRLIVLMDRVKRQIAQREQTNTGIESSKRPVTATIGESGVLHMGRRSAPFER